MSDLGQHIRIRLFDDRVIAPSDRERRIVARAALQIAQNVSLLGFALVDTHFHGESLGGESEANEIARRIGCSLRRRLRLPVGFHVLPPRPIKDLWHLGRCFRYVHNQAGHHGVGWERWYEATSLPDLLGLRPRGGFLFARMREHLPRVRRVELLEWLGVAELRPAAGSPGEVLEGALAASARWSIGGRSEEVLALRRAVMELLGPELTRAELAELLQVGVRTVTRLRQRPLDPELVRAIALNVGLRQGLARRAAEAAVTAAAAAPR